MAVAAPARRSGLQTAPGPSRTAPPPEPKKRPRDRPRPGGSGRSSAAAPAALRKEAAPKRKSAGRKGAATRASGATAAPARKAAPQRKKATTARASAAAPARKAPARRKVAPKRRIGTGARVIPIAAGHAGRAAVAVSQLPESGLIHRLTRGRAWIAVLGVLLVGIVALNVVTLSFAASAGKVDARNTELSRENSALLGRQAQKYGQAVMRREATEQSLVMPTEAAPQMITARPSDVAEAAARLAAAAQASPH